MADDVSRSSHPEDHDDPAALPPEAPMAMPKQVIERARAASLRRRALWWIRAGA